jgi:hypothetical protein
MEYSPILLPVVVLVAWTLLVMLWMLVSRMGEFRRLGVSLGNIPAGSRGADLEGRANPSAQWKSHNYNHLMEQPTIFYAIAITLALMGMGHGMNYWLAWGYVGFRMLHSLVQCTVNVVAYRFTLFTFATLCLMAMTLHAGLRVLHDCGLLDF